MPVTIMKSYTVRGLADRAESSIMYRHDLERRGFEIGVLGYVEYRTTTRQDAESAARWATERFHPARVEVKRWLTVTRPRALGVLGTAVAGYGGILGIVISAIFWLGDWTKILMCGGIVSLLVYVTMVTVKATRIPQRGGWIMLWPLRRVAILGGVVGAYLAVLAAVILWAVWAV